jgi:hypothetical protein
MRVMRFLSLGLVIVSVTFAAATYGSVGDEVPTHFDLAGNPDASAERSPMSWFLLPGFSVAMFAMFSFIGAKLPDKPHWFNFPDKDRFLALPEEYRPPVIAEMRLMLEVALVGVLLTLVGVQVLQWRVATGHEAGALGLVPFVGVLLTPVLLLFLLRVSNATDAAVQRWKAGSAGRGDERGVAERGTTGRR